MRTRIGEQSGPQRAVLLAADAGDESWSPEESVAELARLVQTAGATVVGTVIQRLRNRQPASYLGKGKIRELREQKGTLAFNAVVADDELSPEQQRYLETVLDCEVLDRTAVILDIFAHHARTREGQLQVQLAQYRYRLPRLTGRGIEMSRLGAGINTRGPGETKLESDRRRIRQRIAELNHDIEQVREQRALHRSRRRSTGIPVVSLAGYTNAGKSTLMNALTGADVPSSDQLFATLDPITRRLSLPNGQDVLLTDTVGFIQKLPSDLVAAFRATLEEITEADVILHVVDASSPQFDEQADAVEDELEALGVAGTPHVTALNKIDRIAPERLVPLRRRFPEAVLVSAVEGTGLDDLRASLAGCLARQFVAVEVLIPYSEAALVGLFRARGVIEREDHRERGTIISGRLPASLLSNFSQFLS